MTRLRRLTALITWIGLGFLTACSDGENPAKPVEPTAPEAGADAGPALFGKLVVDSTPEMQALDLFGTPT
jgi:hypothetical protein